MRTRYGKLFHKLLVATKDQRIERSSWIKYIGNFYSKNLIFNRKIEAFPYMDKNRAFYSYTFGRKYKCL